MFFPHRNRKPDEPSYKSPEERAKAAIKEVEGFMEITTRQAEHLASLIQRHISEGIQDFMEVQAKIRSVMENDQ